MSMDSVVDNVIDIDTDSRIASLTEERAILAFFDFAFTYFMSGSVHTPLALKSSLSASLVGATHAVFKALSMDMS